jgi:hypothetical protein
VGEAWSWDLLKTDRGKKTAASPRATNDDCAEADSTAMEICIPPPIYEGVDISRFSGSGSGNSCAAPEDGEANQLRPPCGRSPLLRTPLCHRNSCATQGGSRPRCCNGVRPLRYIGIMILYGVLVVASRGARKQISTLSNCPASRRSLIRRRWRVIRQPPGQSGLPRPSPRRHQKVETPPAEKMITSLQLVLTAKENF